jgi:hypothetical protein
MGRHAVSAWKDGAWKTGAWKGTAWATDDEPEPEPTPDASASMLAARQQAMRLLLEDEEILFL